MSKSHIGSAPARVARLRRSALYLACSGILALGFPGIVAAQEFELCDALADESGGAFIDGGETVTVPGDRTSPWVVGSLIVGCDGVKGEAILDIVDGGKVHARTARISLELPGFRGDGTINVIGEGSELVVSEELAVGSLAVPVGGSFPAPTATLDIRDGGTVTTSGETSIYGDVNVVGAGSTWTSSGLLTHHSGDITIQDGGRASFNGSNIVGQLPSEIMVTGDGSVLAFGGDTIMAGMGITIVGVLDGGRLETADIGLGPGLVVSMSGEGTSWASSGTISLEGLLAAANGAAVSSAAAEIGGSVNLGFEGQGSASWEIGDLLMVWGAGAIDIGEGSRLAAKRVHFAGSGSTRIDVRGSAGARGVLEAGQILKDPDQAAVLNIDGGILRASADQADFVSGIEALAFGDGGAFIDSNGFDIGIAGNFAGDAALTKLGGGTLTLTGDNHHASTHVDGGTLAIADGGTVTDSAALIGRNGGTAMASVTGGGSLWTSDNLVVGAAGTGTLRVEQGGTASSDNVVVGGMAGSVGTLTLSSGGTVSDGNGVSLAQAGTRGTLNIGAAEGEAAQAAGNLDAPTLAFGDGEGLLVFNHTDADYVFASALSGSGALRHLSGSTELTGDSSAFSGTTRIQDGTLAVTGTLGGNATVLGGGELRVDGLLTGGALVTNGGDLSGSGSIDGDVTIRSGSTLRGVQGQTLTTGSLTLNDGSVVDATLGDASDGDALFDIKGDLVLDGTLHVRAGADFGPGLHLVMGYGGTLTDNGLEIGATPTGYDDEGFEVQVDAVGKQVNLLAPLATGYGFWDGSAAGNAGNGQVDGGDGVWTADPGDTSWTAVDGGINGRYDNPTYAIFQGEAGTVTIDNAAGQVEATGLQFAVGGYTLDGGRLRLGPDGVRVGTGHPETDSGLVATIRSDVVGISFEKTGAGTLELAGNLTGAATELLVEQGTLRLADEASALSQDATRIGAEAGQRGTLEVVEGSKFQVLQNLTQGLHIGGAGTGTLTIAGGGTVHSSRGTHLGEEVGGAGTALVTGAGSTWTTGGRFRIGIAGDGTVTLADGGTLRTGMSGSAPLEVAIEDGATGTLNIGAASGEAATAAGILDAASVVFGDGTGTVVFNHAEDDYAFAPELVGGGAGSYLLQHESGTTRLTGDSGAFTGMTLVTGGTLVVADALGGDATANGGELRVNGAFVGDVLAGGGGTLSGNGTVDGDVAMGPNGILAGVQGQTLAITGSLGLNDSSQVNVSLGAAGDSALFDIGGDLTLDGTLGITDAGGFGSGVYRLMDYLGTLTDNGLEVGVTPTDFMGEVSVQTAEAGQVNLAVEAQAVELQFWDGSASGNADNGTIDGGDGTWTVDGATWTDVDGAGNGAMEPQPGFAIFQGEAGTVTIDNVAGQVEATGLQFAGDGYVLAGDALVLADPVSTVRVGDGTGAGADMSAAIHADVDAAGTVNKADLGTLVLTGTNTWGAATVAHGTLQLADGGSAQTGAVSVGRNPGESGVLEVGGSGTWTSSGEVDAGFGGQGTVRLHDGGTLEAQGLRLGGFDGGVGTLVVGAAVGEAAAVAGSLESPEVTFGTGAGTVVFNHTDADYVFGAELLGPAGAGLLQHEAGHTVLTADSGIFSGATLVNGGVLEVAGTLGGDATANGGELRVNGAFVGDVLAGGGGTLSGSGTVDGDVTAHAGATVAPGTSIGTLTITGDYWHQAGATLLAEIAPDGSSDLLSIGGSATLDGGLLSVLKAPGQYQGQARYTLLTAAGGVTGTFDALEQDTPFLDLALAYDAEHVFLDVTRNSTAFGIVCDSGTFNQCQVGRTLDAVGEGAPTEGLQQALAEASTLDIEQAQAAFDRLSGEAHASLSGLLLEGHALHGQSVTRRLVDRREAVGMTALQGGSWVRGYGQRSDLSGDGNAYGADVQVHGLGMGLDAWASESWLVGASVNTMRLQADLRPGDRGEADSRNVSLYTSVQGERAYLDGVVSYAWWENEVERAVQLGAIDARAGAAYDGHRFATYVEAGYRFDLGSSQLQPLVSVQYDKVEQAGFRETGAGDLGLVGRSHDVDRLTVGAGLRWAGRLARGAWTLAPDAQVRWLHGSGDVHAEFDVALAGAPEAGYRVRGVQVPRNRAVLGVGLTAERGEHLQLYVDYDYQHGDRSYRAHQLGAGVRWQW